MNITSKLCILLLAFLLFPALVQAQTPLPQDAESLTLEQCVAFALKNRAEVEQALLDEAIGEREIKAELAGWFPQVSAGYTGVRNIKLQQQPFGDQVVTLGQKYTSSVQLQGNQVLYSSELLLASKAARFTRQQLDQQVAFTKINTVVAVSKAFYDVLLTQEQLRILEVNLERQLKQYNDARSRYEVGLVDKTDYQRAAITLGNIRSDLKRAQEAMNAKIAYLKQLMGYPIEADLDLAYDYDQMQEVVLIDTTQLVEFTDRIELQLLQTQLALLELNTAYRKWSFLPTISAYGNYNWLYFNNEFAELYSQSYPTSNVGLQVAFPIFQGTRRYQNLKVAQLREARLEIEIGNTLKEINTEYQTALANYKSDYVAWLTLQQNLELAQEVYDIIQLQYNEGVKAYVDLVVAETELRTTQLNYYNALYNVLESKLDLQRALGNIDINP
ncbi:outer membrane protein TolC [Pontibacter ummariensis]|uniref:Outer membrane protein TolC n=1 Tax=Pontibacter ummariensis TaxID=1610492 RepID=A0A239FNB7_9BACT|nr:TolC family protein [Pontibacter ummariensis]PRY12004.1 outer membrane protein TolC [Pontibacter ummariensis]SNS58108.1 Outer membrane protein TolC [Pontibacter ummariensis]